MAIKRLTIEGLRGFSESTDIHFAVPDHSTLGSGLTVLVGPNNSGKSTIIEAVHLLNSDTNIIPLSLRNIKTKGNVKISIEDTTGMIRSVQSTENNGAFIQKKYNEKSTEHWIDNMNTFILSSKRAFASTFNNNSHQKRENYKSNINSIEYRSDNNINHNFGGRLLEIYENREKFDECLKKVLDPIPKWTIESIDSNTLYLEFDFNDVKHSSNGAGDGYINIFNIIDALYDSSENNVILIDEPEVSLHPDLQRKLFDLLIEYSKDKQIIVSTHSPYFVDWNLFSEKSKIIRLKKEIDTIKKYELSGETKTKIKKVLDNANNPHILSLNANEIFFLNDNIIVTEGQEDVLCYKKIFEKYSFFPNASFFGWGAGGANNINIILSLLIDLGYEKVFTILDNDKRSLIPEMKTSFPSYEFYAIAANDVRTKRDKTINKIIKEIKKLEIDSAEKEKVLTTVKSYAENTEGLIKSRRDFIINKSYEEDILKLIESIKEYFNEEIILIPENTSNKNIEIIENSDNLQLRLAEKLLEKYIANHELYDYIKKKYGHLEFKAGDSVILSFRNIKQNIYYAIIEISAFLSENHSVTVLFHIIINTKNEKVKIKKKQVISNTLPINKITKIKEKIFN